MVREIDLSWSHGEETGSKHKVKCYSCDRTISREITRLKQHLAHRQGQVTKCLNVPPNVKKEMQEPLDIGKQKNVVQE